MHFRTKLLHHRHSLRLRPHEHTSYVALALVLMVTGLSLLTYTVNATVPYDGNPEQGTIGLSATVPGEAPKVAATIDTPANLQRFTSTPITISGTCPKNTLVEIFKNNIFSGSAFCSTEGTYSVQSDLLFGKNVLLARVYDALNQPGPDSNKVTVFYDASAAIGDPITSLNFGGQQVIINTDAVFRGTFPGDEVSLPLDILGGRAPYAVNIQWGDNNNSVVSRSNNDSFRTGHVYQKAGTYQLSMQVTDADGRTAFLTVAAIVNGQPDPAAVGGGSSTTPNALLLLWPLFAAVFATVVSFWIGEWREKRVLAKRGLLVQS